MKSLKLAAEALRFPKVSIIICNCFVYIEDRLVSLNYLHAMLDELTWRILLQILLKADGIKGGTTVGRNQFNHHFGKCSQEKYFECITTLVNNGLIRTSNVSKKWLSKIPLLAPLWSEDEKTFIDKSVYPRTQKNLTINSRTFAMIPKGAFEAMLIDKSLSLTTIKLILKLYKYFLPSTFTGIDPNIIHFRGDLLYYDERLFYDLGISESDIKFYMAELSPYFVTEEVTATCKPLDKEVRITLCDKTNETIDHMNITILRPLYQYTKGSNDTNSGD